MSLASLFHGRSIKQPLPRSIGPKPFLTYCPYFFPQVLFEALGGTVNSVSKFGLDQFSLSYQCNGRYYWGFLPVSVSVSYVPVSASASVPACGSACVLACVCTCTCVFAFSFSCECLFLSL